MSPAIRLRLDRLTAARQAAKPLDVDAALASAMGCHRSIVSRVLAGRAALSPIFIARLLLVFPAHTFEDLFEVVDEAGKPARQLAA